MYSIEYQVHPVVRSLPNAHGYELPADVLVTRCEFLRKYFSNSLCGGGGLADLRVIVEIAAVERSDCCCEQVANLVKIEGVALLVELGSAYSDLDIPRVAM
jgi:hypothetical protein